MQFDFYIGPQEDFVEPNRVPNTQETFKWMPYF